MKLHLPTKLYRAVLACCAAAFFTTLAYAEVPEEYTPVTITNVAQLSQYSNSDHTAFIISADITDSEYRMIGAHQYWTDDALYTRVLTFEGIESTSNGGVLSISSELVAVHLQELTISHNASTSTYGDGGAIYVAPSSVITLTDNGSVTFNGNSAGSYGGAIYGDTASVITLTDNGSMTFRENTAASVGGAIFAYRTLNLTETGTVTFSKNSAQYGGAIYGPYPSNIALNDNGTVTFSGNLAGSYGGAIDAYGTLNLSGNGTVTFSENAAERGGAIHALLSRDITLSGNGTITFRGNSAEYGGAIYASGIVSFTGNDAVTFRGNYEKTGSDNSATYRLRSVYMDSNGRLNLAAASGQSITFYDTLYVYSDATLILNAKYVDRDGVEQEATGEIAFSGRHAEEDLKKLKTNFTQQELTDSLTSEVYAMTNLYGGRLRIEDGAIYKGNGITAEVDSAATVRLQGGTLDHAGYALTFNAGTTLEAQGVNSITTSSLDLLDGSALTFTLGEANLTTAAVTLTGTFKQGGALTINLADDGTMVQDNEYALLKISGSTATPTTWDPTKVTVNGLDADISDLAWKNGTLYYSTAIPELTTATWTGAESMVWNTTAKNWTQNGITYAYKDGVDVIFGDTGAGAVTLAGNLAPKSVLVNSSSDYTWSGSGKLTGNMTLTKSGTGSLTISTANTYTGGTILNAGTLVAGNASAFGTGGIQVNGGALNLGGFSIAKVTFSENIDVVLSNGLLNTDFIVSGGSVDANALRVKTQTLKVSDAEDVIFRNAANSSNGGAIYGGARSTISLLDNRSVTFSENNASPSNDAEGGAIFGDSYSTVNLMGNDNVTFSKNQAYRGSAILADNINIENNRCVEFVENYGDSSTIRGFTTISNNGRIEFRGNHSTLGGSVISVFGSSMSWSDNKEVIFTENYSSYSSGPCYGGAIYISSGSFSLTGNDSVTFSGNHASSSNHITAGGVISGGNTTISNNGTVVFSGNYALSTTPYGADGGAISSGITISNNGRVEFRGNYVSGPSYARGGAISSARFCLIGNEAVTFRGNYEKIGSGSSASYRLRSVDAGGKELYLTAGEDQVISFYDTLYAKAYSGTLSVSFNADYEDKDSVTQIGAGDIVFSGAYAEEDLKALKADYTQQELTNSITTEVYAMTHLYGGRLRIEDGAIYKGNGITAEVDSAATVRLQGGTLSHSGYKLTFNAGTTLEAQGVNSITATSLDLLDGSALTFTLGETNLTTAAVTLTGTFNQGGALTINLADDGTMAIGSKYALLTMASGTTPTTWDASKVTVEGLDADISDLSWSNGTLYLTAPLPELTTATWSGAESMVWNTTAKNWTQDGITYAYKDGVDVIFGDTGAGTITLVGELAPKSVLVDSSSDYTWSGSGKLTGNMTLTKSGTGSLTISTASTYTGGTILNAGTLVARKAGALGTGSVQLYGGTLNLGGLTFSNAVIIEEGDVTVSNGLLKGTLTITGGSANFDALNISSSNVQITNAGDFSFHNNTISTANGGVLCGVSGNIISVSDNACLSFSESRAYKSGGAIYGEDCSISLTGNADITFSKNHAGVSTVAQGGAICAVSRSIVTISDNGIVTFDKNYSTYSDVVELPSDAKGGAIYGDSSSVITLSGNDSVVFSENYTGTGRHSLGGSLYGNSCTINLTGNENILFYGNHVSSTTGELCSADGGAIAIWGNSSSIIISNNGVVSFRQNYAYSRDYLGNLGGSGGAIYAMTTLVSLTNNTSVEFSENHSNSHGGAIYGDFNLSGNKSVVFSGNYISNDRSAFGGAWYSDGDSNLIGNDSVVFSGNYTATTYKNINAGSNGGAIYVSPDGSMTMSSNGIVAFRDNHVAGEKVSAKGGAIHVSESGILTIFENSMVEFTGNYADKFGGAIFADGNTVITGNEEIEFKANHAQTGGAIYNDQTLDLSNNGNVRFHGNYATSSGGAIYAKGGVIQGNGSVEFRGNYEKSGSTYRLRGLYTVGKSLKLSAGEGQSISFYDGIYTSSIVTVTYNGKYMDDDGIEHAGAGDILMSGAHAAEDLYALKQDYTQSELDNSRLFEINGNASLYGGRLRVEDDAVYSGKGITAAVDSAATVRLQGGTLSHSGYKLTFNAGTTLEAQGVNSITASSLDLLDGSALTFTLGEANLTTAAVTLTGTFKQGGALTINLADDGTMELGNEYALLKISGSTATPTTWDPTKVTVNGLDASVNSLKWQNGTLYLGYAPELVTATWSGAESMVWNTTAKNWTQDDITYAYKDGVDVIFGNTGAGTVMLAGTLAPKSVLVDSSGNYTWSGSGTLTGDMTLTKSGTGSLTISTANTYTGGTAINGGKVVAAHATALGTGVVTLSNGTLEIAVNGFANGISASGASALRVEDGYTLALSQMLSNSGILTVSGTVNASALTLNTTAATHIDVNDQSGASGFAKSAYYSVQVVNGGTVGGDDAVITHINLPGTETLVLGADGYATAGGVVDYSNYLLTGSDTATTSAIHAKGAGATVTQTGGTLTVDDAVTVTTTAGVIALDGGTLDGIVTNATINAASGALNAVLSGSNTLAGTNYALQNVVNNGGTLTMSGSFDASALTLDTTAATHIDVNGQSGASGFAKAAIYSVKVANGTTVNNSASITHGTHNLVLGTDGVAKAGGTIDYSNYLLTGSDTASTAAIHAQGAGATVTQQGGTLTVDDTVTVTTTAGSINLTGGTLDGIVTNATINAASGALNAALTGSNTLAGTNYALQSVVNNGGTLTMSGSFDASALTLDTTAATHIDVDGNSGASGFAKAAIYSVTVANGTTVNGGATITHGVHNLVLGTDGVAKVGGEIDYSNYLLTGSDTATTSAIHGKGAGATVTQTSGTLTVDDTVSVTTTAGTISLAGGTLNGTVSGATINAASGALNAALSGSNTLTGTNYALQGVVNNGGTLTMSGSFNASALTLDTTAATHIDVDGNSGASGFAKDAIYSVTIANGTTVNSGASITHGVHNLVLGTDGVAKVGGDIDYSNYLLTGSDTATTSAIHGKGAGATVTQTNGTLTVDDTVTVTTTAGAINLAGGTLDGIVTNATINAASGALNAALSGSNTLTGTNYALQSVVNNSGTLTMSGSFDASALTLDTTAATHIDVNGNSGASGFAKDAIYSVTVANGTTVNSGATITHGAHNLVLGTDGVAKVGGEIDHSNYLLTGSDTATTSAIHGKGAGATVTQQGGTLTVDDTVSVTTTAGSISLAGGTLNGTVSGATINAASGALNAALSGSNTLNGTNYALQSIIANSGSLTLKGTLDLSQLSMSTSGETHVDVDGREGSSGFIKASSYSITLVSGGTVTNGGVTLSRGGLDWTLQSNGVATAGGGIDHAVYYLNGTDSATSSAIHGVSGASEATVTQQGGTLTVDDTVSVTTTAGSIGLAGGSLNGTVSGATINAASGALNAALSGSNTLTGTNYALQSVVNNGGTLTMSGSFDASALTLDTTAATHIDVDGNSGASGFAKDAIYSVTVANGTTVNSGATITHGVHNLVLGTDGVAKVGGAIDYSNYLLTGSDTASTAAIHAKGAGATVTQQGGTLTVDDTVTVTTTAGSISLAGGTLNGTVSGATINAASGALNAALSGSNTLTGTNYALQSVVNNGGTLTMSGSFDASALTLDTTAATHIDVDGNSGASGFAKDAIYSVTVANGTTVNSGATITHGVHNLVLGTDGVAKAGGKIDYSDYLLTGTDTASTSDIHIIGPGATVTQTGGTLTVDDTVTVTTTGGTINLEGGALNGTVSGATINATSGVLNATLNGENALHGNDYALQGEIANNGTLTVSGTFDASALHLDTEAATHIDVNGQSGDSGFAKDASYSVTIFGGTVVNDGATITHGTHNLVLGNDGVAKVGGEIDYSDYLLTGSDTATTSAIHGKGAGATVTQQGGTLTVDDTVTVTTTAGTINLAGGTVGGTIADAAITAASGVIDATVSGGASLSVTGGAVTVNGANSYTGGTEITGGTVTLGNGGTLGTGDIDLVSGTLDTGDGLTLAGGQTLALNGGGIRGDLATAAGATIDLNTATALNGDLTLSGGSILYSGAALNATGTVTITAATTLDVSGYKTEGTYKLLGYSSLSGDLGQLILPVDTQQATRINYSLHDQGTELQLTIDGNALDLTWKGGSGEWKTLGDQQWQLPASVTAADPRFHADDRVKFTQGGTVTITGEVKPGSVLVGGTEAVVFQGTGSITGAASLTKEGTSELTLNAANAYTGGTTVKSGTVHAGGAQSFGSGEIVLQGGTLDLGAYAVQNAVQASGGTLQASAYAGTVTVGGDMQVGSGTKLAHLVVNSGSVTAGSLVDTEIIAHGGTIGTNVTGASSVTTDGNVTLSGTNTYTGKTEVRGGTLHLTGSVTSDIDVKGGALAVDSLALNNQVLSLNGGNVTGSVEVTAGSRLAIDSAASISGTLTLNGGTLALSGKDLTIGGNLVLASASVLDLSGYGTAGVYTLASYSGLVGDLNLLNIPMDVQQSSRLNYSLGNTGTALTLTVDGNALTLTWKGGNGTWKTLGEQEWQLPASVTTADPRFHADDSVVFSNGGTVTIEGDVKPGNVLVSGSNAVLFQGTGSIIGAGSLTKEGSGSLTMNATNSYSGGTTVKAGTVNAGGAQSFGSGDITLEGGTLNLGGYAVLNDIKAHGGTLNGTAYNGVLTVEGNLTVGENTTAKSLELTSGSISGGSLANVIVTAHAGSISSAITGGSSVTVDGDVTLSGNSSYTGRTTVTAGTLTAGHGNAFGAGTVSLENATLDLAGYAVGNNIQTVGGTLKNAQSYLGTLTVNGDLALTGATQASAVTLNTGGISGGSIVNAVVTAHAGSISSDIIGAGSVTVDGNVTLSGANTYSGKTTITAGKLTAGSDRALGAGNVLLEGGTLDLAGHAIANNMTATGGTLAGASAYTGTLSVNGALQLGNGTTAGEIILNTEGSLNGGSVTNSKITAKGGVIATEFTGENLLVGEDFVMDRVLNNAGTLTMSGSFDASALTLSQGKSTHVDVSGNTGASGFAMEGTYSVTLVNGGATVNDGAIITHGTHTLVLGTDGVALEAGAIDYSNYLLTGSDTATTSAIHGKGAGATVTQQGGTLTVDDTVTVTTTGGTINLEGGALNGTVSGATINATSGALNAALSGSNTLNGANYALQSVVNNGGTLTMSDSFNASALTLDTEAATHIDVNGHSGASGFAKDAIYSVTVANGTTVNNGAIITHGVHNLVLGTDGVAKAGGEIDYSDYLLTGSDTASTAAIHAQGSGATVTQQGGTLTVDDTVTVTTTAGSISLAGGTLNGTVSGATINATSGALNAALSGSNTLNGANYALQSVVNNGGTLTMSGSFNASALTLDTEAATHIDVNGNSGASGFAKDAIYSVTVANGTTVNNGAIITHGVHNLVLGTDGVAKAGGEIDYSDYLLTGTDTASTSDIHIIGPGATVTQTGGTLTVDDTVTVTTTGGTINLEGGALNGTVSGATINATSGALNATLNGENALHGNDYALQGEIANNGTLTVSGTFDASAMHLDTEAATHIDVNGQSGDSGFAKDASYSVTIFGGTVVNDGATITHGTHNLELGTDGVAKAGGEIDYSDYLLTGTDTASTSDIHIIGPGATVTQTGGTLTVDDTVTVTTTGGTINLEGGTLNGTVSGATINASDGELNVVLSDSNTLHGDNYLLTGVLNNTGTLILEGTFELSKLLPEDVHQATHIDVNGQSGASGFAKAEQHDITIAIGGNIVVDDAVFSRDGQILTRIEGGKVISGGEIDYSDYLLTGTDTASSSAIHAIGPDATVTQTGGILTVDDTVTVTTTAGTINLAGGTLNGTVSGATINAASGALNAILSGSNTLHGTNYALQNVISNSGTLTVSGTFDASALTLDTEAATHIDVNGQSGANGFAKAVGFSVVVVNGGNVVNAGAEITHGAITLTLGTDGVAKAGGEIDYSTYYLHNGAEVAVSAIRSAPEAAETTVDMDGGLLAADADVEVASTGGRIEATQNAHVSGSIHDTQVAIRAGEISADITGSGTVTVEGEAVLSGHNTYTGDTDVMEGGMLKVTGSLTSDVYLHGGIMDTAVGMTLAKGQDVVFTGGNVRGNLRTVEGSGLSLEQNGLVDGDLTLGGGTLKLGDGCVLSVSGSLTLDAATTLVGDWQADEVYTLIVTGGVQDESGTASLNEFFRVSEGLGTVRMEGNTILLDTHTHHTADAMDTTLVNSLWASSSYIREFARLAEGQSYAICRGETAVWAGGFGTFMNVSGRDGFSSDGAGYAFGVNHAFSTNMRAGVGLGQSFGSYHNKALTGAKVHQKGMMAAATAQYMSSKGGGFMLSGHAAIGRVRNNADTYLDGLAGKSRWDDTILSVGSRASYAMYITEDTFIAPFIGLEWTYGSQESFCDSHGRSYSNGKLSDLRMPVGVTLRSSATVGSDTTLLPELSVAYMPSLVQHNPHADATVKGGSYRAEGYDPGRHGFMLNAGLNVLFSESWSAGAFYTLETRKHAVNQSVNTSLQYRF